MDAIKERRLIRLIKLLGFHSRAWHQMKVVLLLVALLLLTAACEQKKHDSELHLGDVAPDFMAKNLAEQVIVLSNLRGKPIILRFFETNCRFCKADTPLFKAFYQEHRDSGLEIIYIGSFYEDKKSLKSFIDELQLDFPVVMDAQAKLADLYQIKAYPQTIFISPDQKIVAALLGGVGAAELQEIMGKYVQ
jgi:peroxiredoxin